MKLGLALGLAASLAFVGAADAKGGRNPSHSALGATVSPEVAAPGGGGPRGRGGAYVDSIGTTLTFGAGLGGGADGAGHGARENKLDPSLSMGGKRRRGRGL